MTQYQYPAAIPRGRALRWGIFVLACVGALNLGFASGLTWKNSEIVLRPPRTIPVVATEFAFRNETAAVVKIVSLVPLCNCLKATMAKDVFAPGESGVIRVQMPVGARAGKQVKEVRVVTDQGEPTVLRLVLEPTGAIVATQNISGASQPKSGPGRPKTVRSAVPINKPAYKAGAASPVRLRTHSISWPLGGAAAEKAVDVYIAAGRNVNLGGLHSREETFTARLEPDLIVGLYRIVVSPKSTAIAVRGTVELEAHIDGQQRTFFIRTAVE